MKNKFDRLLIIVEALPQSTRAILTIGIGTGGGALGSMFGIPLPWLLGSLLTTALFGIAGFAVHASPRTRQAGQIIIGCAVGLYFTPPVAAEVVSYGVYMVGVGFASILAGAGIALVFARAAAVDKCTAYFASLPGGVAEMSVLAERHGADTAFVALAQSLRVVCVVMIIPPLLTVLGIEGTQKFLAPSLPTKYAELVVMLVGGTLLAIALNRVGVTNAWLLGGMSVGIMVALSDVLGSGVPTWLVNTGQVLIGCALGSRFKQNTLFRLRGFIHFAVAGSLSLMIFGALMAFGIAYRTGVDIPTLVLATAPGGVAEMSITAKVLALGVPLVTAFHTVRVILITLLSHPLFVLAKKTSSLIRENAATRNGDKR